MKASLQTKVPAAGRNVQAGLVDLQSYHRHNDLTQLGTAIQHFHRAAEYDPAYLPAKYFLAVARDLKGDTVDAIKGLQEVLEANPPFVEEVRFNLGVANFHRYRLPDLEKASEQFEMVIGETETAPVLRLLARASLAQTKAQAVIRKARANPDPEAVHGLADEVSGIAETARRELEVTSLTSEQRRDVLWRVESAHGLGLMFYSDYLSPTLALPIIDKAQDHFQKADAASPRNWAIRCNLGSIHMRRGLRLRQTSADESGDGSQKEFAKAETCLREVIEKLRPGYPFARYEIGRIRRLTGKYEQAAAVFESCLQLPEDKRDIGTETLQRELDRAHVKSDAFP